MPPTAPRRTNRTASLQQRREAARALLRLRARETAAARAAAAQRPTRMRSAAPAPGRTVHWKWVAAVLCAVSSLAAACGWYVLVPHCVTPQTRTDTTPLKSKLTAIAAPVHQPRVRGGMAWISGGTYRIGSDRSPYLADRPARSVELHGFWLDQTEVTNAQFAAFVQATGYRTTAEQLGSGYVFDRAERGWRQVLGANWQHPGGPHTNLAGRDNEPVVQVSWHDATAFAHWAGKRLPTEAEWEVAARGGWVDMDFGWGPVERPNGFTQANYWQGWFPDEDLGLDGYRRLAPVASYPANAYGLYDMIGNVWEWCADWYAADVHRFATRSNPRGPSRGTQRVQRGGSWLCAENCAPGYRVYVRSKHTPDSSHNHVGFRCARTAEPPEQVAEQSHPLPSDVRRR